MFLTFEYRSTPFDNYPRPSLVMDAADSSGHGELRRTVMTMYCDPKQDSVIYASYGNYNKITDTDGYYLYVNLSH